MTKRPNILRILTLVLMPLISLCQVVVNGSITKAGTRAALEGIAVRLVGSVQHAVSDKNGAFVLTLPKKGVYRLVFAHTAYQTLTKDIHGENRDTLFLLIELRERRYELDTVAVFSKHLPETLVAYPRYSIYDFDFFDDKFLLLTAERSLTKSQICLTDYQGKLLSSCPVPKEAGEAKYLYHDFEGYTDLICSDSVFRIELFGPSLILRPIRRYYFETGIKPVSDTANTYLYYNNYWKEYPSFNHNYVPEHDSLSYLLKNITHKDLLALYNFEYYYLPSRQQLEARRLAETYKVDVHIVAAQMSGFTQSWFYDPLYAPLFILNDTICIFNHYNDFLYHYNKLNQLIDSVPIKYHHPKNWKDWKKLLLVDETEAKVYAFFSRYEHHYLKQIDHQTGKELGSYKLKNHSAERIKINAGFVYYVYRPFGSTQERFLYREKIE